MRLRTKLMLAMAFAFGLIIYVDSRSIRGAVFFGGVICAFAFMSELLDRYAPKQTTPATLRLSRKTIIPYLVFFAGGFLIMEAGSRIADYVFLRTMYGPVPMQEQSLHFVSHKPELVLSTGEHLGGGMTAFWLFAFAAPLICILFLFVPVAYLPPIVPGVLSRDVGCAQREE